MHRRIHLKKRIVYKRKNFFIIILIFLIVSIFFVFKTINKKINPLLLNYAESKTTKLATLIITEAVNKEILENFDTSNLFYMEKDSEGNIKTLDFNSIEINKLLNSITNYVQLYLENLETGDIELLGENNDIFNSYDIISLKKGIIYKIPSGVLFNNSLLSNLGPKIPVRMNVIGEVRSNIDTDLKNYGINNTLIEITASIQVSLKVILPFCSKNVSATTSVPIALKLIQGEVPYYYYPNLGTS